MFNLATIGREISNKGLETLHTKEKGRNGTIPTRTETKKAPFGAFYSVDKINTVTSSRYHPLLRILRRQHRLP